MQQLRFPLQGIGVINATPLTSDDQLNEAEYRRHVNWLVDEGVSFVAPLAATGQIMQSTEEEFRRVLEITVEEVGDRVLIVAYSGRAGTAETIKYTRIAQEIGADTVYIIQPFFTRPDPEGIYLHYKAVAEAVDIPIIMYNNAGRAGVDLPLDVIDRLTDEYEIFVALKQSDLNQLADSFARLRLKDRVVVMARAEKELLMGLAMGAPGAVTFAGNIIPRQLVSIVDAWNRGDLDGARQIYYQVLPLINAVHIEPVPAAIKYMLNRLGWDFGDPRLPIHPVTQDHARVLDRVLADVGLLEPPEVA